MWLKVDYHLHYVLGLSDGLKELIQPIKLRSATLVLESHSVHWGSVLLGAIDNLLVKSFDWTADFNVNTIAKRSCGCPGLGPGYCAIKTMLYV